MREIVKPAFILLVVCAVTTAILAVVFQTTKPIIEDRTQQAAEIAKKEVLPQADTFKPVDAEELAAKLSQISDDSKSTVKAAYWGFRGTTYVGAVFRLLSRGYDASGVNYTVGIQSDGTIEGIKVGDQKETPGLGTNVLAPNGPYLKQYEHLKPEGELKLVKNKPAGSRAEEIDAVVGATMTSRSVYRAVRGALETQTLLNPEGVRK